MLSAVIVKIFCSFYHCSQSPDPPLLLPHTCIGSIGFCLFSKALIHVFACLCHSLVEAALGPRLPSHPSSCRLLSSLQLCTQTGPQLGCSGDKDVLGCFLGELYSSCTLPYSRACVVLGKGTWNHLSPSLHAEETKAPRGQVAFPSQFTCQDRTHDDSQPRVQPTRP